MYKLYGGIIICAIILLQAVLATQVHAVSPSIMISQVQLGDVLSANNELIEIYNNTSEPVDITDWCLYYASASSLVVGSKIACYAPSGLNIHLFIPGYGYSLALSNQIAASNMMLGNDIKFSSTLSGTAGHIRLVSDSLVEVDKVGWGVNALSAEGNAPAPVPSTITVLQRKLLTQTTYQDTDNNSIDFQISPPKTTYGYGAIYEVQDLCSNIAGIQTIIPLGYTTDSSASCNAPPADVCSNISGIQTSLPTGFLFDTDKTCQPDSCLNISGLQVSIPDGKDSDMMGSCINHDFCANFEGLQSVIPDNFRQDSAACVLAITPIQVSELLANAAGDDTGHEFIELYNPNDIDVDMSYFRFSIGIDTLKQYPFPPETIIGAHEYKKFSNSDISFTLLNTTSRVALLLQDGREVSKSDIYVGAADNMAWALIDGIWQYSDQPTPGSLNLASVTKPVDIVVTEPVPCPAGQYRNISTNRCRLIATTTSTLTQCKDGQYRSEETNRCRTIAFAGGTLTPCSDNQYRSEETNRCRNVVAASATLKPCTDNQYRSEETNRCRTITQLQTAPYAVAPNVVQSDRTGWWVAGGVIILALGYVGWEWRREVKQRILAVVPFMHSAK
jgi:hypothetical protein